MKKCTQCCISNVINVIILQKKICGIHSYIINEVAFCQVVGVDLSVWGFVQWGFASVGFCQCGVLSCGVLSGCGWGFVQWGFVLRGFVSVEFFPVGFYRYTLFHIA